MNIPIELYMYISAALFSIGLAVCLTKKNAIAILIGVELMLNAANVNLVGFSRLDGIAIQGQMLSLFVLVVAACEVAIGLGIIIQVYKRYQNIEFA